MNGTASLKCGNNDFSRIRQNLLVRWSVHMGISESDIRAALSAVKYPGFSRDIVSFGLVRSIDKPETGAVRVTLGLTTSDPAVPKALKAEVEKVLSALDGVERGECVVVVSAPSQGNSASGESEPLLQKVRFAIAVASGKGGVGKSTFSVNLAVALERHLAGMGKPASVGIMDCDIYGPSIPLMLGVNRKPEVVGEMLQPIENFGVRTMSMGLLVDAETPVVWRGPMIMKTIQQFAQNVDWGSLEVLIVDLPPGTGDAQLSLVQTLPLDGALIVTTPQPAAFNVAVRGARMFEKVSVPLLGVAENMSYFRLPDGSRQEIFGAGGGALSAKALETEMLGQVPLDPAVREGSDRGLPIVVTHPDSETSLEFFKIARIIYEKLAG